VKIERVVLVAVLVASAGTAATTQATFAASPKKQEIQVAPGALPPLPAGVEVIWAGPGPQVDPSEAALGPSPMWGCVIGCLHIYSLGHKYDAYIPKGVVAQAHNSTYIVQSYNFSISASVQNTYSAQTSLKFGVKAVEVSAGVGFNVTYGTTKTYGVTANVEPNKTVCVGLSEVYYGYYFDVYEDQFIGDTQYKGRGWAENYNHPYWVFYYC
jgi:hypothetical protein